MIPKAGKAKSDPDRGREPLDVSLTVRFNFGGQAADAVTVIDDRRVPMVGSVFANRDRIIRGFIGLLLKTGLTRPDVARRIIPGAGLLRRRK